MEKKANQKIMWHHSLENPGEMMLIGVPYPYLKEPELKSVCKNGSFWYKMKEIGEQKWKANKIFFDIV